MQQLDAFSSHKKIALLISSMNAGGAERVAAALANAWVKQGHEVLLIPCFSQGSGQSFYPLDDAVELCWLAQHLPKSRWLNRLLKPWALRRQLKAWQADVVVSFLTNVNITALIATWGLRLPVIVCERTDPLSEHHLPFVLRRLRRYLYPRATAVLMQTDAAAQAYAAQRPEVRRVPAIANPIADDLMQELGQGQEGGVQPDSDRASAPKVLLAMGRLVPIKRFDFLIDCFSRLAADFPQWQLHIYGKGPLEDQLRQQIERLGLTERVFLKGATQTPWAQMRAADAFAMTSEREGFPNVLLEAMANALPAVALDCPYGAAELSRQGEVGLLVPLEKMADGSYSEATKQAYVAALRRLLSDEALAQQLAVAGQAHVLEHYSMTRVLQEWEQLFEDLGVQSTGTSATARQALTVVHLISGLGHGGAESVLYRLVTEAKRDRHLVVSMQDEGVFGEKLAAAGIVVHCLNMPPGKMSPRDFFRLRKLLQQLQPDVVQSWMYHADMIGGLAARLAGIKTVVWGIRNSGDNLASSSRSSYLLARYFSWSSYVIPRLIVACGELAAKRHQAWGYQASKLRVIPNGYDLSRWQPVSAEQKAALRQQLGLSSHDEVIAFVGRWNPLKDHANLLSAFALLLRDRPQLKLVLIGQGLSTDNQELMAQVEQHQFLVGEQLLLLGRREDVPDLMGAFDLHVLPSLAEGFPNVVAESMACEVPNVVTDVGDAAFIVDDYGWVVPPQDSIAFSQAIDKALIFLQGDEAISFKQQCRERVVANFSLGQMVQRYEEVWREALGRTNKKNKERS